MAVYTWELYKIVLPHEKPFKKLPSVNAKFVIISIELIKELRH
jgi:hypothetical protein